MITIFLRGGLGNQMFQYAFGFSLAKKNNAGLQIDTVFLQDRFPRRNFTYRNYDLDVFAIEPRFTQLSRIAGGHPIPGVWLSLDLADYGIRHFLGMGKVVREKSGRFDPSLTTLKGDVVLAGWWQSEKYFDDVKDGIREEFRFRDALTGPAAEMAKDIAGSNSISLHVRRGDYLLPKSQKIYSETREQYYEQAARYLGEHVKNPKFFVFSDDISWCRKNLKLPFPTVYVDDALSGPKASYHLNLMSLCRHNVIANSTFSWWGAWLNRNPQKIVVAPKQWMVASDAGSDIIPEGWIKM